MKAHIWFSLILLNFLSLETFAAGKNQPSVPSNLQQVHQAISTTQNQINKTASEQKKIDVSMAQTGQQLNQAKKELEQIRRQQQTSFKQYQALQTSLDQTQTRIAETKTQVSRLLNAHYRNRQPNSVYLWLKKDSVDQKGRTLQYLRYLNAANEQVIQRLRQQQQNLETQQKALTSQRQQLNTLHQKQQQLVKKLHTQHNQQQNQFSQLDQQLSAQNKQLQTLKSDEKRLNSLLSRLSAQSKARKSNQPKSTVIAKNHKEQTKPINSLQTGIKVNTSASDTADQVNSTQNNNHNYSLTSEDMTLKATEVAQPKLSSSLAQKQGRLQRPVSGTISGKFGEQRPNGGTWKGLFFNTSATTVHSIASGNIVYAAYLQGYGNTIIIDHGDGYLSIYTGLSAMNVSAGKSVSPGQSIGTSGQLPDGNIGLYFEIRYHNQAMNPLSWIV